VSVCHERRVHLARAHILKMDDGLFVVRAEDRHPARPFLCCPEDDKNAGTSSGAGVSSSRREY